MFLYLCIKNGYVICMSNNNLLWFLLYNLSCAFMKDTDQLLNDCWLTDRLVVDKYLHKYKEK